MLTLRAEAVPQGLRVLPALAEELNFIHSTHAGPTVYC